MSDVPLYRLRVGPESFTGKAARGEQSTQKVKAGVIRRAKPASFLGPVAAPVRAALTERQLQARAPEVGNYARSCRADTYQSNTGAPSTSSPTDEKWIMLISACLIAR